MTSYRVILPALELGGQGNVSLEAPSVRLALIAADINLASGAAELWEGDRMLARVQKQPGRHSVLWSVE